MKPLRILALVVCLVPMLAFADTLFAPAAVSGNPESNGQRAVAATGRAASAQLFAIPTGPAVYLAVLSTSYANKTNPGTVGDYRSKSGQSRLSAYSHTPTVGSTHTGCVSPPSNKKPTVTGTLLAGQYSIMGEVATGCTDSLGHSIGNYFCIDTTCTPGACCVAFCPTPAGVTCSSSQTIGFIANSDGSIADAGYDG